MIVKRMDSFTVLVDNIKFEYDERAADYLPASEEANEKHRGALHRFLTTENPTAEKEYQDYYQYIRTLNKLLNSIGICSVQ
jgi:hypothetical protein